jgi:hypothetical protein
MNCQNQSAKINPDARQAKMVPGRIVIVGTALKVNAEVTDRAVYAPYFTSKASMPNFDYFKTTSDV